MYKHYKIAGLNVAMKSFGRTVLQAEPYLADFSEQADITIDVDSNLMQKAHPGTDADLCEYLCTGISFYRQLLLFGGLRLHASAVVVDGKAYLFTADSGVGKSTHTQLYLKEFGDRAFILNDDKPALRLENDGWFAYGTPWSGKHDISVNGRFPVAGIAVLERGEENTIERFSGLDMVRAVIKQVNRPKAAEYRVKMLELLDNLVTNVPIWRLRCNTNKEAALVSYLAMSHKKGEDV
jgi:hypothetical protein